MTSCKWQRDRQALRTHPVKQRELSHRPAVSDLRVEIAVTVELPDKSAALEWSQDHVATFEVQVVRVATSLRTASKVILCAKPLRFEESRFHLFNGSWVVPNHRALATQFQDFADYSSSCRATSHMQVDRIADGCQCLALVCRFARKRSRRPFSQRICFEDWEVRYATCSESWKREPLFHSCGASTQGTGSKHQAFVAKARNRSLCC